MICIALCWCLNFEKQILLPVMIAWLQQLKSLCLFSGMRGLPPELLPCLVGTGYKGIAESAVRLMVGMLVLRALVGMDPVWPLGGWDYLWCLTQ